MHRVFADDPLCIAQVSGAVCADGRRLAQVLVCLFEQKPAHAREPVGATGAISLKEGLATGRFEAS